LSQVSQSPVFFEPTIDSFAGPKDAQLGWDLASSQATSFSFWGDDALMK
jgi:hypothetical protein